MMSHYFRIVVAVCFGLLLGAGPFVWCYQFKLAFRAALAKQVRDAEIAAGNADASRLTDDELLLKGVGAEVPSHLMTRIIVADLLIKFWWVWAGIAATISYGLYVLMGRYTGQPPDGRVAP